MNIRFASGSLGVALLAASAIAQTSAPAPLTPGSAVELKTEDQRIGYALGLQLGSNLHGVELDTSALLAGIRDGSAGAKPQLTNEEIDASLNALQRKVMLKADPKLAAAAEANGKAGDAFLAANGKKDGVKTTASGLQYKVITSGKGKTPAPTDIVSVNYRGTLVDGTEFDASKGTPVSFPVNGVIPGWTEALQLMKEGDHWQIVIPAKLAYGLRGPPSIGPDAVLVFDVELLTVKPGDAMPGGPGGPGGR